MTGELNRERVRDLREAEANDELINVIRAMSKAKSKPKRESESDVSNGGDTLTHYRETTVTQCQADCAKNGNCQGFTFTRVNGYQPGDPAMCCLIARITGSVSHSCCISGRKP